MYNNYNNPYYNPIYRPLEQQYTPAQQNIPMMQQNVSQIAKSGLQGKLVDNVEVVRATDIPMDGSISYFPIADGSAIVTKQLQNDGTSKIIVFRPITDSKSEIKYITQEELKKAIDEIDLSEIDDIKEDIKEIKKQIKKKSD